MITIHQGGFFPARHLRSRRGRILLSITLFVSGIMAAAVLHAAEPGFHYKTPEGWTIEKEPAAVVVSTSPDQSIRIIIRSYPMNTPRTALMIIKDRMAKVKHDSVVTPPTDMSQAKDRFNADTLAKMQLAGTAPNGGKFLYRAFVFTKGNHLVAIEAIASTNASEATFKQADGCINSFRFK